MKRIWLLLTVLSVSVVFHACQPEDDGDYDETLLYGKWKSGTLYYRYDSDHTGSTWDTGDDVQEAEGQPFTWTLVKSELRQIHIMEMGGNIPKTYTVTELTATTLKYSDSNKKSYTFAKTN